LIGTASPASTGHGAAAFLRAVLAPFVVLLLVVSGCTTTSVLAPPVQPLQNERYAAIVVDARTGQALYEAAADEPRFPASLTKMMTVLMLFEALDAGFVTPTSEIPVSAFAAAKPPTKIGFRPGQTIDVHSAILALNIRSANDVAAAVGEYIAGSEPQFAAMMTQRARQLGMRSTTFRNASGLPDPDQRTTARDMAVLSMALRRYYPHHYHYFSNREFSFAGNTIRGHNDLIGRVPGVDGIKTGYIRASGFNLATSVSIGGRQIVAVVMGGENARARNAHMEALIEAYLPRASRR
jgi:D-alanyl-D-alanine carboxypeptidase